MGMTGEKLLLRPYLEKVEKICGGLKKKELIALIVAMASEEDSDKRQNYLSRLMRCLPDRKSVNDQNQPEQMELLLGKVQELEKNILAKITSIEDGSYWDDPDDVDDGYWDDEPECLSDDQMVELAELFAEAGEYFCQGMLIEAKQVYAALFSLVGKVEEYDFLPDIGVDIREAHARYCRSVYETSRPGDRAQEMAMAMKIKEPVGDFENFREMDMALLRDVIDAQVGELPGMADFLTQWQKVLAANGRMPDRLARLRVEASFLQDGIAGVRELARDWKKEQPVGYLAWLEHLAADEEWRQLADAAREALAILSVGSARRRVAGYLVEAGRRGGDEDLVLPGRREAFVSSLNVLDLLHLVAEAERRNVRNEEIARAIDTIRTGCIRDHVRSLLARAFLMIGDLQSLAVLCKEEKVYGWSGGSPGALMFCAVLYCNAKGDSRCVLNNEMLADYADSVLWCDTDPDGEEPATSFYEQIVKGLAEIDITREDFIRHQASTMENGRKRVEYIVSNKYRNAYNRAACTLGAMAEMLVAQGAKQEAKELLHKYYYQVFSRYSAFRREVREAVAASPLLTGMGV
ncbi:hypothetical protein DGMP_27610 [Desulfomarina profundi]|uniref:Uncharacterized protein n=1 Tax=Desulfomarina profundi TaxID=2772557 RepID=A0A8D5FIM3_9BACT|nr:hypothetical protein [Desulfomarina profundi]BCL62068.1 hypothetical protein DGMP_27610 [Desulfomarina profundi]